MTFQRGDTIMFAWAPASCTSVGLHDWGVSLFTYIGPRRNLYRCSVCRASGTYTGLEYDRYIVLRDERLSAQETRRGRK